MSLRTLAAALVMLCASITPVSGRDTIAAASLRDAQRALSDALERHDRAAFEALFAPDAQCTLPAAAQGPKAIADLWVPFLIDPGTTMLMTAATIAPAASGDRGTTAGAFAIRGHTSAGVQTIPAGQFSIDWRIVGGRWRIVALSGAAGRPRDDSVAGGVRQEATDRGGVGPYRFGMTRDEVRGVSACEPYMNVATTGGLECPAYAFEGQTMNVSFVFGEDGLRRVQLWFYEGESGSEAREAVGRVLDYLQKTTGGSFVCSQPGVPVTVDGVIGALDAATVSARRMATLEIRAAGAAPNERWFSRVARHQHGYLVLLLADPQ